MSWGFKSRLVRFSVQCSLKVSWLICWPTWESSLNYGSRIPSPLLFRDVQYFAFIFRRFTGFKSRILTGSQNVLPGPRASSGSPREHVISVSSSARPQTHWVRNSYEGLWAFVSYMFPSPPGDLTHADVRGLFLGAQHYSIAVMVKMLISLLSSTVVTGHMCLV